MWHTWHVLTLGRGLLPLPPEQRRFSSQKRPRRLWLDTDLGEQERVHLHVLLLPLVVVLLLPPHRHKGYVEAVV